MSNHFKYANEWQFWYFLARLAVKKYESHLPAIFKALNRYAQKFGLPIRYESQKSLVWAVLCQLFVITRARAGPLGKLAFNQMLSGFEKVLAPKKILNMAYQRILSNINSPLVGERTEEELIANTFLANGLTLENGAETDPLIDTSIIEERLTDSVIMSLGMRAVEPPFALWDTAVEEYSKRRPAFLKRYFYNPDIWLFKE